MAPLPCLLPEACPVGSSPLPMWKGSPGRYSWVGVMVLPQQGAGLFAPQASLEDW